jgi:hypothetical protein
VSQRDYEEQPEAPDLAQVVQEDPGETLVGPADSDPLEAGYVPPDRPYVVDDYQALYGDDQARRLARERPDVWADEEASVADREPDRAPRLEAAETTPDTRYTESLEATGVGLAGGAASAEEAAVHLVDEDQVLAGDIGADEGVDDPGASDNDDYER